MFDLLQGDDPIRRFEVLHQHLRRETANGVAATDTQRLQRP